ncbi:hypothetical protein HYALB_00004302 [Hymenoscyphus albidus]|uniref:Dynactin subunit 4 n=1 Tax=Hymenoscyphus albidus TaxID=595503 RepID=A0A9N9M3F3_9HELO|nr:hypothetical protein HYALB_00004302 [Hymenoscyphus albidus]
MANFTPYTYFQCPCADSVLPTRNISSDSPSAASGTSDQDERTFDPRAPRSNYSLYPLEHLLYCEDCHQIRCPRCVLDEIVTHYCPNCLFEVPNSIVKSEGTRCTRSCFQCPICIAPLSVSAVEPQPEGHGVADTAHVGQYVLNCAYCLWSSKDIGVYFDKPNAISAQLARIKNGGGQVITPRDRRKDREGRTREASMGPSLDDDGVQEDDGPKLDPNEVLDPEGQFSNLKSFYQSQIAEASPTSALGFTGGDYGYGSPGALSRIMGIYTGGTFADKKVKSKKANFREARDALEGLQIVDLASDADAIKKLQENRWQGTTSLEQRAEQLSEAPFVSDLRPLAYVLRTKRSKRCKTCRHILSKPESKVQTTRFRIRLVALNYIPAITIRPLQPLAPTQRSLLTPRKAVQFLLTFKNPLFENVKVSIATPAHTPGRFKSKVTVLCPQFEVGANTDAWEEALREGGKGAGGEKRRTKAEAHEGQNQAEAGQVWEQGRNWVSVVVEVIPPSIRMDAPDFVKTEEHKNDEGPLREDEDVVEIPAFVRVEWEADAAQDDDTGNLASMREKDGREKRELAYWCVLGLGRIARE